MFRNIKTKVDNFSDTKNLSNVLCRTLNYSDQSGQAVITSVLFFVFVTLIISIGVISPAISHIKISSTTQNSIKSFAVADSGAEDATYRIRNGMNYEDQYVLSVGDSVSSILIEGIGENGLRVFSAGDVQGVFRRTQTEVFVDQGNAFHYGVQSGNGGFIIEGGSTIDGNVYSNGDVVGSEGSTVTGSVTSVTEILGKGGSRWWQPFNVEGDSWAPIVRQVDTGGTVYCQESINNSPPPKGVSCDTSRGNPTPAEFPISDELVDHLKEIADLGQLIEGNYSVGWAGDTLGPVKITGDLSIGGGGTLTLTGTVWVEGSFTVSGGGKVYLDESYENESGVLVVDGRVNISGNGQFQGSGQPGSYPVIVTTSTCPIGPDCGNNSALYITGGSGAVILIAQNGELHLQGGSAARSIIGETIRVSGGGTINYDSGLADLLFSSGPGGGYKFFSWNEVE